PLRLPRKRIEKPYNPETCGDSRCLPPSAQRRLRLPHTGCGNSLAHRHYTDRGGQNKTQGGSWNRGSQSAHPSWILHLIAWPTSVPAGVHIPKSRPHVLTNRRCFRSV